MLAQQPVQEPEHFFLINSTLRASPLPQQISPLCQLLAGIPVGSQGACSESPRRITEQTQKGGSCCHRKNLIYCPVTLTWTCFCHKIQLIGSWRRSLITSGCHISTPKCHFSRKAWFILVENKSVSKYVGYEGWNFTSLYSWIWLCSNMENTLEDPPSPCCCLLLAFLGACEMIQS